MALEIFTPPTSTGFKTATGVMAPVLPTCNFISSIMVVACFGENLKARTARGLFPTIPNLSNNKLTDLKRAQFPDSLQKLNLQFCQLREIDNIHMLKNLKYVNLSQNYLVTFDVNRFHKNLQSGTLLLDGNQVMSAGNYFRPILQKI